MLRHGAAALPSGSYYGPAPGGWVRTIAEDRIASARAASASDVLTAARSTTVTWPAPCRCATWAKRRRRDWRR